MLDGAVVVFDGVAGVEPQSETNWRYADDGKVPRLCFVNKMDRMGASFERSFKSIFERLNKNAVRFQLPIGLEGDHNGVVDLLKMKAYFFEGEMGDKVIEKEIPADLLEDAKKYHAELIEKIVEHDDTAMQAYLDGKEPSIDELKKITRKAVIDNKMFPVFTGSALEEYRRATRARRRRGLPAVASRHAADQGHRPQYRRRDPAPRLRQRAFLALWPSSSRTTHSSAR